MPRGMAVRNFWNKTMGVDIHVGLWECWTSLGVLRAGTHTQLGARWHQGPWSCPGSAQPGVRQYVPKAP